MASKKKDYFSQLRKAGNCLVKQGSMLWGFGLAQPATVIL
tara:strand:+ start:175 stop:294 length:120 start_codon:yes stop_codon:yes gene_type:complete